MIDRLQKKIWLDEHIAAATLPSLAEKSPSSSIVLFIEYLKEKKIAVSGKIIDIGCGKGRNAIYLAQQGFETYAIDYIEYAIKHAKQWADREKLTHNVHFFNAEIDHKWNFSSNFFDYAIDCFSSIDIETEQGRLKYKLEMLRTLKQGGHALICVVAAHDEWEQQLIKLHPGQEKNSSIWPTNGKFQKNYDEEELRHFYREFEIVELRECKKTAIKLEKQFTATNYWLLLRKP